MKINHEISKTLFQIIDDLWVYAAPLILAYAMKDFIMNLIAYTRVRWSKMDYNSEGGKIYVDGYWQVIIKISINIIAYQRIDKETKIRIITTVATRDYWKAKHVFEGKIL